MSNLKNHPKGEKVPQTVENLQAIMAEDANTMLSLRDDVCRGRAKNNQLRQKLKQLQSQADQLRAENDALRADMESLMDIANEHVNEAEELRHLARFLAGTWSAIDKFVHKYMGAESVFHYPVIQGTSNQINLRKIGAQDCDQNKVAAAVSALIEQPEEQGSDI